MSRLSEKDLAERWNVTTRTLQLWRAEGRGPAFVRIGPRSMFYRIEDVLAYEAQCVVGGKAKEPEGWRSAMTRAAGAFDLLADNAKNEKQKETLAGLRDEIRALLA